MDIAEVKELVIKALFSDDELMEKLVIKGGTAFDTLYKFGTSRASIDVDISIKKDLTEKNKKRILERIADTFLEQGYKVFDLKLVQKPSKSIDKPKFWGGYLLEFKLLALSKFKQLKNDHERKQRSAEVVGPNQRKKFKVDFSKYEFCDSKQVFDLDGFSVFVYSTKLLAAEKLRAICQQMAEYPFGTKGPRARDFFDIHVVSTSEKLDWQDKKFAAVVKKCFKSKQVDLLL